VGRLPTADRHRVTAPVVVRHSSWEPVAVAGTPDLAGERLAQPARGLLAGASQCDHSAPADARCGIGSALP
jgi:hypothetical protein